MCLDLDCTLEISCPHLLASAVDQPGIQIELYTVPGDGRTKLQANRPSSSMAAWRGR